MIYVLITLFIHLNSFDYAQISFSSWSSSPSPCWCSCDSWRHSSMIKCLHPRVINIPGRFPPRVEVPCGKCSLCLSRRRSEWAFRCMVETQQADSAYFITLTYNEDNVPEICDKKEIQKFFKRFRKRLGSSNIRYLLVPDYGGKFGRPHYHFLLWNYPHSRERLITDLKKSWTFCEDYMFDYGDTVGDVEEASINYVCGYCLSSLDSDGSDIRYWMLCSRRPAIGKNYLSSNMVRFLRTRFDGCTIFKGKKIPLPRYIKDKVFTQPEKELIALNNYLCKCKSLESEADLKLWFQYLKDKDYLIRQKLKHK